MIGCGNHGCILKEPEGIATNGRCRCLDGLPTKKRLEITQAILSLREVVLDLEGDIQEMIDEY